MKKVFAFFLLFVSLVLGAQEIQQSIDVDGAVFKMNIVPVPEDGTKLPVGDNDHDAAVITAPYWIGETEVTWELWKKVYDWSLSKGYSYLNSGRQGGDNDNRSSVPVGDDQHPVTTVAWGDTLAWCNALTEWSNENLGTSYTFAYFQDGQMYKKVYNNGANITFDKNATGFRLPDPYEWQLAARWRNDDTNTVEGYSSPWFTKANSDSGAAAPCDDFEASKAVAVIRRDSTAPVKSLGPSSKNSLGLYDMSGNVWEYVYTKDKVFDSIYYGGSWKHGSCTASVTSFFGYEKFRVATGETGFRLARSADGD